MATSNWQHISYCCEVMFALAPESMLDVGMGYGRWGMLAREMCDIWRRRVFPDEWQVEIVGIEAYEQLVQDYHSVFYSQVIVNDALAALQGLERSFDLAILGDVLEHLERPRAEELLKLCRAKAHYTLLSVPLGADWEQDELYGNPYERHRSQWRHGELKAMRPVCHRSFHDFRGRRQGVYVFASGKLDTRAYWRGRRWSLLVPSYPELRALQRGSRLERAVAAVHRRLKPHPRLEAAARRAYHVLRAPGRLLGRGGGPARPAPPAAQPQAEQRMADASVPVLAVVPREFFGVTTSTLNNFPNVLLCAGKETNAEGLVEQVLGTGCSTVVLSGLPPIMERTAQVMKARSPGTRLLLHWHGSLAQNAQPPVRAQFRAAVRLAREGVLDGIGCAKAGMVDVLRGWGLDACYVPYTVAPPGAVDHHAARSPRRLGVFVRDIERKNPHTQLVAASMVADAEIHASDLPDLSYWPDRPPIVEHGELPYPEFLDLLGGMDLCLYVSLSECYPMLVVESLIRGVPCLTSHTHEILGHDEDLARRLIVRALDNPAAIARQAEQILADREELGRRCAAYALQLNRRAEAAINDFVGADVHPRLPAGGECHEDSHGGA